MVWSSIPMSGFPVRMNRYKVHWYTGGHIHTTQALFFSLPPHTWCEYKWSKILFSDGDKLNVLDDLTLLHVAYIFTYILFARVCTCLYCIIYLVLNWPLLFTATAPGQHLWWHENNADQSCTTWRRKSLCLDAIYNRYKNEWSHLYGHVIQKKKILWMKAMYNRLKRMDLPNLKCPFILLKSTILPY